MELIDELLSIGQQHNLCVCVFMLLHTLGLVKHCLDFVLISVIVLELK